MEHIQAAELYMAERYLLNEMTPELREEFEEHIFDCQECAAEVRMTAAFLEAARGEMAKAAYAEDAAVSAEGVERKVVMARVPWWSSFLRPAVPRFGLQFGMVFALAACVLVIVYQNAVVFPGLRGEVARLEAPEVLPSVSLVSGNSRGGVVPAATSGNAHSMLLLADIPAQERFSTYTCILYSPDHQQLWAVEVPAEEANDTVSIRVPMAKKVAGTYSLQVRGHEAKEVGGAGTELANYSFTLDSSTLKAGPETR